MKEELVSIIIPVHNSEKYIEECINSAINQTYSNLEIIAVYDNYPDNSLKKLNKFGKKITIISTKKCNIASARNKGIEQANGEWIKFLDSDDVLYPNAVKDLVSIGNKLANKKNTILYSNYEEIDSDGKVIRKAVEKNFNNLDQFAFNSKLLSLNFLGYLSSSLVHHSTLESYGLFNEKFIVNEDWELWLRFCILHNCRLHLIPKFLVKHRKHAKSITSIRKKIVPEEKRSKTSEKTKEFIISRLEPNIREKYEIAVKKYKEDYELIVNELKKTEKNLLKNQEEIKELYGLDVLSKKTLVKTSINFLYNVFIQNKKINTRIIKENKNLRKKIKELRSKSQEFSRFSSLD